MDENGELGFGELYIVLIIGLKSPILVKRGEESLGRLKKLNEELSRILGVLITDYQAQKVILFGSLVNGQVHEFTDIDLIVIKETEKAFYERLEEVILLTMPRVGADILVYTPEEFEAIKGRLFFEKEVLEKGSVLYDVTKP